jgi:hypothetical protein
VRAHGCRAGSCVMVPLDVRHGRYVIFQMSQHPS